ncbi:hypothetical protein AJ78_02049 [Emergomyces pasteurianus Ep9510]|uniref:DUF7719 domain-containing protein n=1 Tax=Emergomyces pasteurianus Ep9510 TaxID=1447872 RepID=A0A1J9QRI4_9EURO|nr:hypothetical protein AJ78_02049 [Emergomyces pasteurianus Ep9510]
MPPRNRKERRAAQASSAAGGDDFDSASIPLRRPPANNSSQKPKAKTLYEIAAEREAELGRSKSRSNLEAPLGTEFVTISPEGKLVRAKPSELSTNNQSNNPSSLDEETDVDEPIPPLPDTILLSLPLSALHFTLSFLAAHQYAQDIPLRKLIKDTAFISFPALTLLIHFAHGHIVSFDRFTFGRKREEKRNEQNGDTKRQESRNDSYNTLLGKFIKSLFPPSAKSVLYLSLAFFFGGRLIAMTNEASYYAVMKKTPSIGTLWVWAVLELSLVPAIFGVLVPIGWAVLYKGYGII